ncbi:MAG: hypothetical protein ABIQ66_07895 [Novosphingobium sp.]
MSRVAKTQTVNKQMYRHFAVITVMLTLVLAIFADGSNRENLTDRMRTERQRVELEGADSEMFGKHKLGGTDSSGRMHSHGDDGGGSMDEGGQQVETVRATRNGRTMSEGEASPEFMAYSDLGVASLPTKPGTIITNERSLPPGLGPLPPKSGRMSGMKQRPMPGAKAPPTQANRNQLIDSGFRDAGAPTL